MFTYDIYGNSTKETGTKTMFFIRLCSHMTYMETVLKKLAQNYVFHKIVFTYDIYGNSTNEAGVS